MLFALAFLFRWLPSAFYAATVASEKGYSGFRGGVGGGFLFGPVALIGAVCQPVKESKRRRWDNDPDIQSAMARTRG
jgi:hypothetical protein